MREAKNTARALVRIGYDGRVHKEFRAANAKERFENEVRVLKYLEQRGCEFVPRLLEADPENLRIVTTNCGSLVQQLSDEKVKSLFDELKHYGVRHEDPFLRNITYRAMDGRFCIIDFEFATILEPDFQVAGGTEEKAAEKPRIESIRWSGKTDIGKYRPNNEDAFLAITFDSKEFHYLGRTGEVKSTGLDFVFAVSDGMGGEKSGSLPVDLRLKTLRVCYRADLSCHRPTMLPASQPCCKNSLGAFIDSSPNSATVIKKGAIWERR